MEWHDPQQEWGMPHAALTLQLLQMERFWSMFWGCKLDPAVGLLGSRVQLIWTQQPKFALGCTQLPILIAVGRSQQNAEG